MLFQERFGKVINNNYLTDRRMRELPQALDNN